MQLATSAVAVYVLKKEQESKNPTKFHLKDMSAIEKAAFLDSVSQEKMGPMEVSLYHTQRCIRKITGLKNDKGKAVPFKKSPNGDYISMELLNKFPQDILNELSLEVATMGGLVEPVKKP